MTVLANNFMSIDIFLNELQLLVMIASFNINYPAAWVMRITQLYQLAVFDPVSFLGKQCKR